MRSNAGRDGYDRTQVGEKETAGNLEGLPLRNRLADGVCDGNVTRSEFVRFRNNTGNYDGIDLYFTGLDVDGYRA